MKREEKSTVPGAGTGPLREARYDLAKMLSELPDDREALKLGHELIKQEEIGRVFKLKPRKHGSGREK